MPLHAMLQADAWPGDGDDGGSAAAGGDRPSAQAQASQRDRGVTAA